MPSSRPAHQLHEEEFTTQLQSKLHKLEEMLESTKRISRNPFGIPQEEAQAFRDQTKQLVSELEGIDRSLNDLDPQQDAASCICAELQLRIHDTVQRLARENSDLMASIKAQQKILSKKIARLKTNKNLLKTYNPQGMQVTPSSVDSRL